MKLISTISESSIQCIINSDYVEKEKLDWFLTITTIASLKS